MFPYALSIFLSAFLVFVVELIIGKFILPWFGGTPSVWTTCLLFFQLLLLGGYAYAYLINSIPNPKKQKNLHLALIIISIIWIAACAFVWGSPLLPSSGMKPSDSSIPVLRIALLLTVSIGLPFFILSSNGPLIQSWFCRVFPKANTYRLYSLSNLGSMLGLLSYPLIIEPVMNLKSQGIIWSAGYILFSVLTAYCAIKAGGIRTTAKAKTVKKSAEIRLEKLPPVFTRILWVALPTCASVILMASTNQMCQEVAVIPFLWVLPLILYLLSFIICFDNERWYKREIFLPAFVLAVAASCYVLFTGPGSSVALQIPVYSFTVFVCAMVCHGELARLKPGMKYLTLFYLLVSTGGALGGVFVAIAAPIVFTGFWEFQLGLWLVAALIACILIFDKKSPVWKRHPLPGVAVLVLFIALGWAWPQLGDIDSFGQFLKAVFATWYFAALCAGALLLLIAYTAAKKILRKAIPWLYISCAAGCVVLTGTYMINDAKVHNLDAVKVARNFFGVLTVQEFNKDDPAAHHLALRHGIISHGIQFAAENKKYIPTTYYHRNSGSGLAVLNHPDYAKGKNIRVGVVGLGVGTLAAYSRPGDYFRFYEINPLVQEISYGPHAYFSYLNHAKGKIELIMGDARLSLERELKENNPQRFDVLAVDAFSSDSIPVHLLTKEAVELYFKHLSANGILALHITNRHLDLKPVVLQIASSLNLKHITVDDDSDTLAEWGSTWMLLANDSSLLDKIAKIKKIAPDADNVKKIKPWTDDYSNLIQIIIW